MKKIFIAILILVIVGILFATVINNKDSEEGSIVLLGNQTVSSAIGNISGIISLSELQQHNSVSDCWVIYKNKVYDVTAFIPNHPGGQSPIASTCGSTNFESAFQKQHGTSKANLFMKVTTYKGDFTN